MSDSQDTKDEENKTRSAIQKELSDVLCEIDSSNTGDDLSLIIGKIIALKKKIIVYRNVYGATDVFNEMDTRVSKSFFRIFRAPPLSKEFLDSLYDPNYPTEWPKESEKV